MHAIKKLKSIIANSWKDDSPIRKGKERDYVFVHINKTAGTSIAQAIGLPRKQHLTALQIIDLAGEVKWKNAYKFTFVRNPWDKVVSHYKYRVKTNQTGMGDGHLSFTEWIKCTYGATKDYDKYYDNPTMFLPQVEWLKNANGKIEMDYIGKFETLLEDFQIISNNIGLTGSLPHLNKTTHTNYRDYYDEETKQIIIDWFKDDLTLFNYAF